MKSLQIEWNTTNLNAVNELLDFFCEFSTVIHCNFVRPWIWCISNTHQLEKIMEMHGNFYYEASSAFDKIIEALISNALDIDIRQWFADVE